MRAYQPYEISRPLDASQAGLRDPSRSLRNSVRNDFITPKKLESFREESIRQQERKMNRESLLREAQPQSVHQSPALDFLQPRRQASSLQRDNPYSLELSSFKHFYNEN